MWDGRVITLSIHNYYLAVLQEAGIVGLLAVAILILSCVGVLARSSTSRSISGLALIAGVLVHQLTEVTLTTGTFAGSFIIWFAIGLSMKFASHEALEQRRRHIYSAQKPRLPMHTSRGNGIALPS